MKKNASVFYLLLSAATFLLLTGCEKKLTDGQTDPLSATAKGSTLSPLTTPDIYVCGSDNNSAVYWKNGVEVSLTGGTMATGIVAIGGKVYVCGYGPGPTGPAEALYWYNGTLTRLTDGSTFVLTSGIAVSGSNVYICGYAPFTNAAYYWENGVQNSLPSGEPTGIAVSSTGDIYISNDINVSGKPTYYLNGVLTSLPGDAGSYVLGVTTNGSHYYFVGADQTTGNALLWRDGVEENLVSTSSAQAMAVTVDATTGFVYSSGVVGTTIGWWNNSDDFNPLGSGEFVGSSTGVAVDASSTVYVCGSQIDTSPVGAYVWEETSSGSITSSQVGSTSAICHSITLGQ